MKCDSPKDGGSESLAAVEKTMELCVAFFDIAILTQCSPDIAPILFLLTCSLFQWSLVSSRLLCFRRSKSRIHQINNMFLLLHHPVHIAVTRVESVILLALGRSLK